MMARQGATAARPRLRFPEFQADWDRKSLITHLEECGYKVVSTTSIPIFSSSRNGLIPQSSYYDGYTLANRGEYGVVPPNAFVYRHMSDDGRFVFNINETGTEIAVSKEYPVFQAIDLNTKFLLALLNNSSAFKAFAQSQKAGGTRTRLYFSKLRGWKTFLPSLTEQQKIADCLTSLDEVIAAQGLKVEALKAHKRGLMQELFPREGETRPRLRFPEFRDAPEWKSKRLEEVAPLQRGFDLPSAQLETGEVPVVYSNGIRSYHKVGMAQGPGLVTGRSGTIGNLHFIDEGDYWPHNTSLWVTTFKGHDPKFIYFLYAAIGLDRFASGSGVPTLNRNDVHSFETRVPVAKDEQQRIADCLSSLDTQIVAETKQLNSLKIHKQGLMQQLFPAADADGA